VDASVPLRLEPARPHSCSTLRANTGERCTVTRETPRGSPHATSMWSIQAAPCATTTTSGGREQLGAAKRLLTPARVPGQLIDDRDVDVTEPDRLATLVAFEVLNLQGARPGSGCAAR
jgi:hypothetical protein